MPIGYQCKEPNCPNIIPQGERYCNKHKKGRSWGNTQEKLKLYQTTRWQKLRLLKLNKTPICEVCNNAPATAVHHIKQARFNPELQYNSQNLQSICHSCHARESQREATESKNSKKIK